MGKKNSVDLFSGFDSDSGKSALPEPRKVKQMILSYRQRLHKAATEFAVNKNSRTLDNWRKALFLMYLDVRSFLYNYTTGERDFSDLKELDDYIYGDKNIEPDTLLSFTQKMDLFIHAVGITDINVRNGYKDDFGFEFLRGTPFNMDTRFANWELLKQNFKNVRKLLRNDTDFFGLVIGGNRVGKSTLSLRLSRLVKSGFDEPCLTREDIVMSNDDFWDAANRDKYNVMHIDEMSSLFYSKDHSKKGQKKRKKKLKTFAKRNMFAMGCDTQFFQIDKEFVQDKIKCVLRVPKRGVFEFYSKGKVRLFDKDRDTGAVDLPNPDFRGRFPVLEDEDWKLYKSIEDEKEKDGREIDEEDDGLNSKEKVDLVLNTVLDNLAFYLKVWGGRLIVNRDLVAGEVDEAGVDSVKRGKAKIESYVNMFLSKNDIDAEDCFSDRLDNLEIFLRKKLDIS